MTAWLAYLAFRVVETMARMMPASLAWRMGAVLGWICWWLTPYYRRLLTKNLTIAFGKELAPAEIRRLSRRHMVNLGGNLIAGMKMPFMKPKAVHRHLEIEGIERVKAALEAGTGAVYVLMHMGNWEILCHAGIIAPGSTAGGLYQPLRNRWLNAHVLRCRERTGSRMFNRREGFLAPVSFVRENKVLAVLSDQRAGDSGVWCPFFGRLVSTTTLPALIAKRAGAPMFPVGVITTGPGKWRMVIGEALPGISGGFSAEQAAAVMNERLEEIIRRSPADWFWVHNRWKTPHPEFLLTNVKRGLSLAPHRAVEDLQPFEIIIRSPDSLSEACLSIPAVRSMRRGRPDARITVLAAERLADLWRMEPEVDEVISFPAGAGIIAASRLIKATGRAYDAGILFPGTLRSALEMRKAGVPRITGYQGRWRKWLLDQVIPPKKNPGPLLHESRHFLRIAWRLGANVEDPTLSDPLPGESVPDAGVIIGICPGASFGPARRWPVERFAEVAKLVSARVRVHWLIFGTVSESALGAQLADLIGSDYTNFTGTTRLAELAVRLHRCRALLTNDNGAMHLAALLSVPVVAVFGSTEPALTGPQGAGHAVVRRHVECSPCFLRNCPLDFRCMLEIAPERVADAVLRSLTTPATV